MSTRNRASAFVYWSSLVLSLLLALVALPPSLLPLKPFWAALVVVYWALEAPEKMPIGRAFLLGLAGDLLTGSLLGEQALRLAIIAFIVLRLRARMRFFPMLQQSLAVLALLVNDRVVMLMIRAFAGGGVPDWRYWVAPAVGTLAWPWLFLALDVARQRARPREA
jgi:rod shape-determining protein MreD